MSTSNNQTQDPATVKRHAPAEPGLPAGYKSHLKNQIIQSLRRSCEGEADPSPEAERRVIGTLVAWSGLTSDGDAVEAMLAAQMVVTHDLAMAVIGAAVDRTGGRSCYFGDSVTEACKVARANLQQIETLARYRTWRRKTEREALQQTATEERQQDVADARHQKRGRLDVEDLDREDAP